jgi:hypothetical protein
MGDFENRKRKNLCWPHGCHDGCQNQHESNNKLDLHVVDESLINTIGNDGDLEVVEIENLDFSRGECVLEG